MKKMIDLYRGVAKHHNSEAYIDLIEMLENDIETARSELETCNKDDYLRLQGLVKGIRDVINTLQNSKNMVQLLEEQEKLEKQHIKQ